MPNSIFNDYSAQKQLSEYNDRFSMRRAIFVVVVELYLSHTRFLAMFEVRWMDGWLASNWFFNFYHLQSLDWNLDWINSAIRLLWWMSLIHISAHIGQSFIMSRCKRLHFFTSTATATLIPVAFFAALFNATGFHSTNCKILYSKQNVCISRV